MEAYGKGRIRRSELLKLARATRESFWKGIEFLKGGKKIDMITTDDLEEKEISGKGIQYKLRSDYIARRAARRAAEKKKKEGSSFRWAK